MAGKLEKIIDIGIPVTAAIASVFLIEKTGLPEYIQNYEFDKAQVTTEYFGRFFGFFKEIGAYVSRGAVDLVAGTIGGMLSRVATRLIKK